MICLSDVCIKVSQWGTRGARSGEVNPNLRYTELLQLLLDDLSASDFSMPIVTHIRSPSSHIPEQSKTDHDNKLQQKQNLAPLSSAQNGCSQFLNPKLNG